MKLSLWLVTVSAIALPLTCISISSSMAQEVNCANERTQQAMNLCARQEFEASDKQLNQTYQQLLSRLRGEPRRLLATAQQAWIGYRNATCAYKYDGYTAGAIASTMYSKCLRQVTERRIQDLQGY
ncbi:MAG TPA: hypothetical protein DCP31_14020 [Cyanobacteria bacterium UBA8543]|nr:hypothetical protein [Cyanobacteria bacterium UBA8543]